MKKIKQSRCQHFLCPPDNNEKPLFKNNGRKAVFLKEKLRKSKKRKCQGKAGRTIRKNDKRTQNPPNAASPSGRRKPEIYLTG
ncbi:hypothetical protein [Thiomicrorhabdus sp.]|uniref:hypothetical protein n=1 Tax=Thiomicrorhabdus sp. TaxID=2039724 RepID=UPI0029C8A54B|nr:hypothetical protein [Thiomicrorhabdus sp.]